jgi:hypothetical protein
VWTRRQHWTYWNRPIQLPAETVQFQETRPCDIVLCNKWPLQMLLVAALRRLFATLGVRTS